MDLIAQLARELNLKAANVEAAVKLIDEGNTIPFISRYRKEATGGMDDVALRALDERLSYLRNLEQRKEDVILLIDAQGKLTPELKQQIREATQLQRVEDLYKPYRKKRMTRAQKAREAGLEPLAGLGQGQRARRRRGLRQRGGRLRHAREGARRRRRHRGRDGGRRSRERRRPARLYAKHRRHRRRGHRPRREDPLRAVLKL